jgi:cell division protein FtsQ
LARKKKFLKRNRKVAARKERRQIFARITLPKVNWSRVLTLTILGAAMMMGHLASNWLMDRPIDAVVINGAFQRVTAVQLEETLTPHVETGFLNADLNAMRAELEGIAWVANASVSRRWPGSIEVLITEETPAACWGDGGLLNIDGDLFVEEATHVPAELPRLNGPDGSQHRVAAMYFQIQQRLEHRGLTAVSLQLDGRGAWEFVLNNGIVVRLGASAVDLRLNRFFVALDQVLASRAEYVDYIDMRYTNGFAIGWKDQDPMHAHTVEESGPNV